MVMLLPTVLCLNSGCATKAILKDASHPQYRRDSLFKIEKAYADGNSVLIIFRAVLAGDDPRPPASTVRRYWLMFNPTDVRLTGRLKIDTNENDKVISYEQIMGRRHIHKKLPNPSVIASFHEVRILDRYEDRNFFSGYPNFTIVSLPEPELEAVFRGHSGIGYGLSFHYAERSGCRERITDYTVLIKEKKRWMETIRSITGLPFALVLDAVFFPFELFFLFKDE